MASYAIVVPFDKYALKIAFLCAFCVRHSGSKVPLVAENVKFGDTLAEAASGLAFEGACLSGNESN